MCCWSNYCGDEGFVLGFVVVARCIRYDTNQLRVEIFALWNTLQRQSDDGFLSVVQGKGICFQR